MKFSNGSGAKIGLTIHSSTYRLLHISEFGPLCKGFPQRHPLSLGPLFLPFLLVKCCVIRSAAGRRANQFWDIAWSLRKRRRKSSMHKEDLYSLMDGSIYRFTWFADPWLSVWLTPLSLIGTGEAKLSTARSWVSSTWMTEDQFAKLTDGQLLFYSGMRTSSWLLTTSLTQYPAAFEDAFKASGELCFYPSHRSTHQIQTVMSPDPKFSAEICAYREYRRSAGITQSHQIFLCLNHGYLGIFYGISGW